MKTVKQFLRLVLMISALSLWLQEEQVSYAQEPVDPNDPTITVVPVPNDDQEVVPDTSGEPATEESTTTSTPPVEEPVTPAKKAEGQPKKRRWINEAFFHQPIALSPVANQDGGGGDDDHSYGSYLMAVTAKLCGKVLVGRII